MPRLDDVAGVPGFEPGLTVLETAVLAANTITLNRLRIANCGFRLQVLQFAFRISQSAILSFRFFMRSVTSALSAKLFKLEAIRRFLLVLSRDVIPVLALGALKRDVISWHNPTYLLFLICYLLFDIFQKIENSK